MKAWKEAKVHAGFSCSRPRRIGFDALDGLEPVLGGLQAKTRRASARHGPPSTVVRRNLRRNAFGRKPSRRELKPSRQCRRARRTRKKESRTAAPHELAPGRTTLDPNQEKVCLERTDDPRAASSQEKGTCELLANGADETTWEASVFRPAPQHVSRLPGRPTFKEELPPH